MKREINAHISVIDPVEQAIQKVKTLLFQPFKIERWFIIGFCAFLAYLGSTGGGGGGHVGGGEPRHGSGMHQFHEAKGYVLANLVWIIPVVCVVAMAAILIWLVLAWLSSRGQFMFLHCVARDKAEVKAPWKEFRPQGNSLFLFRIVLGLICLFTVAIYVGLATLGVLFLSQGPGFAAGMIVATVFGVLGLIVLCIVFFVVHKFTLDFVVPIMFLRGTTCVAAWREFMEILSARKGAFALYILFQIVITMVLGALKLAAVCVTCCCAGCIMLIPYIGTVLLLPLLSFSRAYSLCYLSQFGPEFDVFTPEPTDDTTTA
jgi:hypothetical protein